MAMLTTYFKLKKEYREKYGEKTLLLFQVGAFYEVYTKVDKVTKEITESQVTEFKRFTELASAKKTDDTLMLGFRDYVLDKYVDKIQKNGYTAVVYSQDAPSANTTRSLLGIFSPGTFFSVNNDEISNNLSCLWIHHNDRSISNNTGNIIIGMSNIDNFTGKSTFYEVVVENIHNPTTYDELERFISTYNPNETIIISNMPDNKINDIINYAKIESKKIHKMTMTDNRVTNAEKQVYQTEMLNKFFSNNISESLYKSCLQFVYGIQSYVYLLNFVFEHNPNLINKIQEPLIENNTERLLLANHSLQQLNIIDDHMYKGKLSSISSFLNNCITSIGMRNFKSTILNPTTNKNKLEINYNITEYLLKSKHWKSWRSQLKDIKDIEKLNRQIYLKNITPFHLFSFYENLSTIQKLFNSIGEDDSLHHYFEENVGMNISSICDEFREIFDKTFVIEDCKEINTLDIDINFIQHGVHKELDDVVTLYENSKCKLECVREYLDSIIAKGEKSKRNVFVKIHETDKYGIMVQCTSRRGTILKQQIQKGKYQTQLQYITHNGDIELFDFIPDVHTNTATGANVNISNEFITKLCNNITQSKQKMKDLIKFVYNKFIQGLEEYATEFSNLVHFTSTVDLLQNMCYIAEKYNYCKPSIKEGDKSYIIAKELRHPLIEQLNTDEIYVSNDISIGTDNDLMLLYGTNAVGKTSIIRAVGVSIIMAQAGLFVPCKHFEFVPYTGIFTRILGNDNLFKGLSTFAVEMSELRVILQMANENSLILGDELCSGTEHDSAVSIFVSGLESLYKKKTSAIFATHLHEIVHYDEIKAMDTLLINHLTVSYNREKDFLIYDRKLRDGPGESMYGLEVCKSLHLPDDFLENAYAIRRKYNNESGILSKKTSHFNSKKLVDMCEMCKTKMGIEVHHLQHQESADKNNMITHFHKNHPANLLTLCEQCHQEIHKSGKQHKKKKTGKGVCIQEI
tara:strand:- start:792 stop:3701 length:2910 start_codon:yes stop_codon:yes gene_type:complete